MATSTERPIYGTTYYSIVFRTGPVAASLSPSVLTTGSDATLTVNGSGFATIDSVLWNGTPLSTTYVSSTPLQAVVPASDLTAAGSANVTVWDPNISNASNAAVVLIGTPQLHLSIASVQRVTGNQVQVTLTVANAGTQAQNVTLAAASLGGQSALSGTGSIGTIGAGSSALVSLVFSASVAPGSSILSVKGHYTGGSFGGILRVIVP